MVVSYRLSIITIALSLSIRPQFAIECLRHSNQQKMGHFGWRKPTRHDTGIRRLVFCRNSK